MERFGRQRGASLVEAMAVLCLLCLIFFALLQVARWCETRMFCHYAAYYGAKGMALGYRSNIAMRSVRAAAIPVCGLRRGDFDETEYSVRDYMTNGDGSYVSYEYWYPNNSEDPRIQAYGGVSGREAECTVKLFNLPLLSNGLDKLLGLTENPEPEATVKCFNYSQLFLE